MLQWEEEGKGDYRAEGTYHTFRSEFWITRHRGEDWRLEICKVAIGDDPQYLFDAVYDTLDEAKAGAEWWAGLHD